MGLTEHTYKNKVWVPTMLLDWVIEWYHLNLCHGGIFHMINTIGQLFGCPRLHHQVQVYIMSYDACQHYKITKRNPKSNSNLCQHYNMTKHHGRKSSWTAVEHGPLAIHDSISGKVILFKIMMYAVVGANSHSSPRTWWQQQPTTLTRNGCAFTHSLKCVAMTIMANFLDLNSKGCWTATASQASLPPTRTPLQMPMWSRSMAHLANNFAP